MRIAFLTSQFPGIRMGGIGGYTLATASGLADAGHEVHVFTGPLPEDVRTGVDSRIHLHAVADLATQVTDGAVSPALAGIVGQGGEAVHRLSIGALLGEAVLRVHRETPFQVVEGPEYEALTLPLLWRVREMAAERRPAVVTQIHSGSAINRCGNSLPTSGEDASADAMERAAVVLADALCAPTEAVVRESRRLLGFERAATIIPLAVSASIEFTMPAADGPVVFVGRIERLKGADMLCEAAELFLRACPTAVLQFVGPDTPTAPDEGTGERSMRGWIERRLSPAVRERVRFTGEVSPTTALGHMRAAKFIVAPSLFENFSLVAAQALGLGRPVISTEGIGTVEVIGETGLTFPRGDAKALAAQMERLWTDESLLQRLARAAFERAATQFAAPALAARRAAFYAEAIAQKTAVKSAWGAPEFAAISPLLQLTHALCGVRSEAGPASPGRRLLRVMEQIAAKQKSGRAEVLLYGAGKYSSRLMAEQAIWQARGHAVVGFVDDAARWAQGGVHHGLPVVMREGLLGRAAGGEAVPAVVLCTDTFEDQFWEKTGALREAGVAVYRLSGARASGEAEGALP